MNFFEQQAVARRQSKRLLLMFVLAVVLIVTLINIVVISVLRMGSSGDAQDVSAVHGFEFAQYSTLMIWVSLITLSVIAIASLFKMSKLSDGGSVVAQQLGARLIASDTNDPLYQRYRNVVEEIAIASSVPVPGLYVLEQEDGINAFAAGYAPADAVIAVTRGALVQLSRDQLQGVIAHEFSHILNGDMRLNIRLMGVLFGILVVGIAGREVLRRARGGGRNAGAIMLLALGIMTIGYAGVFFGRLIKAGISRQREYLADASAVQFTRQAQGIADALKKIATVSGGSRLYAEGGEEVAHMLFADGLGFHAWFATHPPILDRISRLDRSFKPYHLEKLKEQERNAVIKQAQESTISMFAAEGAINLSSDDVVNQLAQPSKDQYSIASALVTSLDEALKGYARSSDRSPELMIALALHSDSLHRKAQIESVAARLGTTLAGGADAIYQQALINLPDIYRLPLVSLSFPALRRRARPFLVSLMAQLDELATTDGQISLFEYCMTRLIKAQLADTLRPSDYRFSGARRMVECQEVVRVFLAVFASQGHKDMESARAAYVFAMSSIEQATGVVPFDPPLDWSKALDQAWPVLNQLNISSKQLLIEALVKAMSHDGQVCREEAELLRLACALLRCPLPPILSEVSG